MGKEIKLPSGAKLDITLAPLEDAKHLYQTVFDEYKPMQVNKDMDMGDPNLWKNLFFTGLSSKKIDAALKPCLDRATYNGLRIDKDTFEPADTRQDYWETCMQVAWTNIEPFSKGLYAKFSPLFEKLRSILA